MFFKEIMQCFFLLGTLSENPKIFHSLAFLGKHLQKCHPMHALQQKSIIFFILDVSLAKSTKFSSLNYIQ